LPGWLRGAFARFGRLRALRRGSVCRRGGRRLSAVSRGGHVRGGRLDVHAVA